MEASACESCGWAAAVVAMLSFGSFGVPIKSETCQRLSIDPLVFQSYKSVVCFITAGLVMMATGHPFRFTPWGIVSALFWVPGGVATVAAVQLAGLALAIAVGNSLIALVSFTWGIFVFQEPIHSQWMACVAVGMMILGFTGMSYFSTRAATGEDNATKLAVVHDNTNSTEETVALRPAPLRMMMTPPASSLSIPTCPSSGESDGESIELVEEARQLQFVSKEIHDFEAKTRSQKDNGEAQEGGGLRHRQVQHVVHHHSNETVYSPKAATIMMSPNFSDDVPLMPVQSSNFFHFKPQSTNPRPSDPFLKLGNWDLSRQQVGIGLAVFNGCWGGSIMVPMKFCPDPTITSGIGYVWSFSIGAVVITAALWVLRYLWAVAGSGSPLEAYQQLPSLHLREMWRPGGLSGLLWSIGNLFSILSVDYLGEGVGYCVCQASMLVSGLWGIFHFHEVRGAPIISKWFLSAFLTVSGILLLSYEHHAS